eukprot:m.196365 g.196365  ORF g.196365 m.196365 type:complete len:59 (+) comp17012_c0_seq4:180-356(+)
MVLTSQSLKANYGSKDIIFDGFGEVYSSSLSTFKDGKRRARNEALEVSVTSSAREVCY